MNELAAAEEPIIAEDDVAVLRLSLVTTLDVELVLWGVDGEPLRYEAGLLRILRETIQAVEDAAAIAGVSSKGSNVVVNGEHVTSYALGTTKRQNVVHPADRSKLDGAVHNTLLLSGMFAQMRPERPGMEFVEGDGSGEALPVIEEVTDGNGEVVSSVARSAPSAPAETEKW